MGENVRGGGEIFRRGATMISLSQREEKKYLTFYITDLLCLSSNEEIL